MQIWDTQEKGKELQNVIEGLFEAVLSDWFKDVLEGFVERLLIFRYFEDGVQDHIAIVANCIEVSLQNQSIWLCEEGVFIALAGNLTALQDF